MNKRNILPKEETTSPSSPKKGNKGGIGIKAKETSRELSKAQSQTTPPSPPGEGGRGGEASRNSGNSHFSKVLTYFSRTMGVPETELNYSTPFELLVAVILSAQCTDKRINQVTPRLFADYPVAEAMALAEPEVIYDYIRSVSYPNNKARHLVAMARMLVERHGGEVPSTLDELTALPGVGRKTANVIQAVAFGKAAMPVDTHVFRVSHRLGLVPESCTTPLSVERELSRHIPAETLATAHHWLLLHGRYVCLARKPKCAACGLNDICPSCLPLD